MRTIIIILSAIIFSCVPVIPEIGEQEEPHDISVTLCMKHDYGKDIRVSPAIWQPDPEALMPQVLTYMDSNWSARLNYYDHLIKLCINYDYRVGSTYGKVHDTLITDRDTVWQLKEIFN